MKNSEYTYTNRGMPAMAGEEVYFFSAERYTDRLRQAEMDRRIDAVTQPETPSATGSPALLKRLAVLGQIILNL